MDEVFGTHRCATGMSVPGSRAWSTGGSRHRLGHREVRWTRGIPQVPLEISYEFCHDDADGRRPVRIWPRVAGCRLGVLVCAVVGRRGGVRPFESAVGRVLGTGAGKGRSGRQIVNVLPRPSSLSTAIVPSCASTMALVMVSPRPVPGIACRVAIAVRK